ncbi:hypothetical protein DIE20_11550 [Burkholderia sp. Bp9131]|uniref:hypothetical protein n=1 Tax=Burkholderia sp. Bp9131 TaxID=2184571 RepID=UPI000F576494|nr:hypothetical protein [Burkholderia sp. Bp9131]RQR43491.1 hypothetical protein DIE20_11550 [Burkholderia sp. Bp9131]
MKENDVFALAKPIDASVIGTGDIVELPIGTVVSVVLVFGDPNAPTAYEVEAFLEGSDTYVLATVEASDVP